MITILGIDPGSRITGYGIVQDVRGKINYVASGCLRLTEDTLPEKLNSIYNGVAKIVELYQVQEVSVEMVFMHLNANAALKLGQARGAAIVGASNGNSSVFEYSAKQIKQSVVGHGGADKSQIQNMVMKLLNLSGKIQVDSADALAAAICHANSRKNRVVLGGFKTMRKGRII